MSDVVHEILRTIIGVGLVVCNTLWTCRWISTFERNILCSECEAGALTTQL
jgi:hypothetical protein